MAIKSAAPVFTFSADQERATSLSLDSKKFIGTTLVSSLVHAVLNRSAVPSDKRHRFCIFVDEMQNFTTSDDFAVLFTQARKFGIATTIAHQDRYGQLGDNRPLAGIYREYAEQETALGRAETAILQARNKTAKLLFLFKRGKGLRLPIRALNRFLTAIMEGRMT